MEELPGTADAAAWFAGRLPGTWFAGPVELTVDREEILVLGELAATDLAQPGAEGGLDAATEQGRISRFREETRQARIEIAQQAEQRYGRTVAWGARLGSTEEVFTTISVPVMTRLRQPERLVLDTLVESGVARSRSDALAWAVRLVGEHSAEWLDELRTALRSVEEVRAKGPGAG